eukprot:CAMPEP_0181299784 /NCGR_PEP_ID=MMETSP1101-20121128/6536_1 /TAXON_ID=46948 /ORGANISM="Rhodomonas abbreviata, Strain Caron Lab Isolate" /LENGTH=110 /DNA_ID=CAMNT_0023404967 /DNA_START=361 /DNA_END=693 /DNA_ORIENTATION=-
MAASATATTTHMPRFRAFPVIKIKRSNLVATGSPWWVQLTEDWIDPKAQEWVQDLSLEAGSEVLLCELWNEPEEFAGLAPTAWVRVHHERCTCQDEPLVDSADEDCNCSD